eukprot:752459-Hanusia_phi.AAC.8
MRSTSPRSSCPNSPRPPSPSPDGTRAAARLPRTSRRVHGRSARLEPGLRLVSGRKAGRATDLMPFLQRHRAEPLAVPPALYP